MGFRELALEDMAYSGWLSDEGRGRRLVSATMGRLDESWSSLRRTTISVACVTVACAAEADRPLARRLVSSMLGMASMMCDCWAEGTGSVTRVAPGGAEMRSASDETDAVGRELAGKADGLLGAVMVTLLTELPVEWSSHFRLAGESLASLGGVLPADDAAWAARAAADEQRALFDSMSGDAMAAVEDGSPQLAAADEWAGRARGVHARFAGLGARQAMARVIGHVGFPAAG